MEAFIKPFQWNAIRTVLRQLLQTVYFAGDYRVYEASKQATVSKIHEILGVMTPEQTAVFNGVELVRGQEEVNVWLETLKQYIIPFPTVTPEQIKKLFPKVKKLTIPNLEDYDLSTLTYLGWRDLSTKELFIVYEDNRGLEGIQCRYTTGSGNRSSICSICHQAWSGQDVALVVARTKSREYKSIGMHMCLDSQACNSAIHNPTELTAFVHRLSS